MSGQMIPYFRCWLCWGVINPKGSVFNLDLYSLFFVNKELLSLVTSIRLFATVCKFVCFEILGRFERIFAVITLVRLAATLR